MAIGRYLILALLVSISTSSKAQFVDHLWMDDPTGHLTIHGDFGSTIGTVYVDNVSVPILSWTTDSISVQLADSGRGSCGPVQIATTGRSNTVLLSMWYLWSKIDYGSSPPLFAIQDQDVLFSFRADLVYLLKLAHSNAGRRDFWSTASASVHQYGKGHSDTPLIDFAYDSTIRGSLPYGLDLGKRAIYFRTPYINLAGAWSYQYDLQTSMTPSYQPTQNLLYGGFPGGYGSTEIGPSRPASFIPSDSVLALAAVRTESALSIEALRIEASRNRLTISVLPAAAARRVRIVDPLGRLVSSCAIPNGAVHVETPANFAPGVYFAILGSVVRFTVP